MAKTEEIFAKTTSWRDLAPSLMLKTEDLKLSRYISPINHRNDNVLSYLSLCVPFLGLRPSLDSKFM